MDIGIFVAFGLFFLKHFYVDFPCQTRWMYQNKGMLGHPGGIAHAGLHGVSTMLLLGFLFLCGIYGGTITVMLVMILGVSEALAHYWIDWGKMNINQAMGWGPTNSECFWYTLGADQFFHYMTYLIILAIWFSN